MKFVIKERIKANAMFLFDLTQDYSQRHHWDSLMKSASRLTPVPIGKGSKLRYTTYTGMDMIVQYQTYHRGRVASIRMISKNWLMDKFAGGWRFNQIDGHQTEVIFAYSFRTKCLSKVLEPIVAKGFKWENERRIRKLKQYAEHSYDRYLSVEESRV